MMLEFYDIILSSKFVSCNDFHGVCNYLQSFSYSTNSEFYDLLLV